MVTKPTSNVMDTVGLQPAITIQHIRKAQRVPWGQRSDLFEKRQEKIVDKLSAVGAPNGRCSFSFGKTSGC